MSRHPSGPAATAARLTWGALAGPALDDDDRARLALGLGGVVLFERNVESPDQLRALTAAIRAAAAGPVRISMDQEGGHVIRVGSPMTRLPGPMAIAATGSVRLAREVAAASARELRSIGVDTVLAPVLDVAAMLESPAVGTRSYGDRPSTVAKFGAAAVRGYLEGGVLPVAKHLPGHGRSAADSHVADAHVAGSRVDLLARDLPPFEAAVIAGAPALMTAHVTVAALDPDRPATLSPALARLARGRLGFRGALVTDALVMDAIADRVTLQEAGVLAIAAGMDVVMAIEGQRRVLDGLTRAIQESRLPAGRLRDARRRAVALDRMAHALPGRRLGEPLPDALLARHEALARDVARRSITLVADPARLLPLARASAADVLVIDLGSASRSPIEGTAGRRSDAGTRLARALGGATVIELAIDDGTAVAAAETAASHARLVVLLTRDAFAGPQAALVQRLAATAAPLVHVALRNPLDLALVDATSTPTPPALVAAFADTPATIDALADVLVGRAPFRGRLPVTLPPLAGSTILAGSTLVPRAAASAPAPLGVPA